MEPYHFWQTIHVIDQVRLLSLNLARDNGTLPVALHRWMPSEQSSNGYIEDGIDRTQTNALKCQLEAFFNFLLLLTFKIPHHSIIYKANFNRCIV